MVTIAERIVTLREEREDLSNQIEALRKRRELVSAELVGLEQSITPRKTPPAANPNDVVMTVDPAAVALKGPLA